MVWLDYDTNDNLSTNCQQIVLVLSYFCLKFVTTKTTKIFVICEVLDKIKTKVRQMTNCLQIVYKLSQFCLVFVQNLTNDNVAFVKL